MSFLELRDYHAFVTGAAGGIGQAIVLELLGIRLMSSLSLSVPYTKPLLQRKAAESPHMTSVPYFNLLPRPSCLSLETSPMSPPSPPA